jgi:hypothetical protein
MQALLESLVSELNHDPILATYAVAWLALNGWGVAVVVLAYCCRLLERARLPRPTPHRLFPQRRR